MIYEVLWSILEFNIKIFLSKVIKNESKGN
jgi:hypothetical protein